MRTHTLNDALEPLIAQGEISAEQAEVIQAALSAETAEHERSRRHLLAEVLSYVGGAVIVISAAFIVAQAWEPLGAWGRSGLITFGAIVLFVGGWLLSQRRHDDSARRLSGTLFTGAAALLAIAVGNLLMSILLPDPFVYQPALAWRQPASMAIAGAAGLVIAIVGYLRVRSVIGQASIAVAAAFTLLMLGMSGTFYADQSDMPFPTAGFWLVFALGVGWIAISRVGVFAEQTFALVVGAVLVLVGAQATRGYPDTMWISGSVFVVLGFAFLALYVWWRVWPMLAAGIAAVLIGGIELFVEYLEGIGAALGGLALGIALLVLGLFLPRLRRTSHE